MEKLNIQNLFNCQTGNNRTLDVKSIIDKTDDSFDIKKLVESREQRRKKLVDIYRRTYVNCIKKIDVANSINKTDLLYTIAPLIADLPDYDPRECLKYIDDQLKGLYFDTYIVNATTIFITWLYIEVNINNISNSSNSNNSNNSNNSEVST
ncbi:MAG: hypothetical protein Terrestrivirus3_59 [Terrestrivirus sp.]|uniref:Uncharacterized protein n=1 Tax=Terrestrivirus sp. TaxID=2487775 RepID=A0A3G4ZLQ6_9VIRU|nr:MAG: hypothetical protein Terrestrivirus3_59 [Terrestrivirus sp.]